MVPGHRRGDIRNFAYDSLAALVDDVPELPFDKSYDFSGFSIGELLRYARDPEVCKCDKYLKILIYAANAQPSRAKQEELRQAFPRIVRNMMLAHDKHMDADAICDLEAAVQYILERMQVN